MNKKTFVFFLNWIQGWEIGLTGGDRIWTELIKRWNKLFRVLIIGSYEAGVVARRNGLENLMFLQSSKQITAKNYLSIFQLLKNTLFRTISGTIFLIKFKKKEKINFIYSSSDFPADTIPVLFFKLLNPLTIWIAGYYLFVLLPWKRESPYREKAFFRGLFYWLSQLISYQIVKKFADFVFVTSEPDVKKFVTVKRSIDKVIAIQGGVDIRESEKYLRSGKAIPVEKRKYTACFVGRLHYQKGVLELIDIWKKVCLKNKKAKLAIVGIGILEDEIKSKIEKLNLKENIDILGFKDGIEKFEVFKNSKIIVHPATFDSGGMAAAEGMAWGLPGVSFDLESLKSYYPRGMIKVQCYDLNKFAEKILNLDSDLSLYNKFSVEARNLIVNVWDWNKRAKMILRKITE